MTSLNLLPVPSRRSKLALLGIVGLGLTLRLWTIGIGVPHNLEDDEPVIIQKALQIIKSGDFNPHFFDYGGLTIYLHVAVASAKFIAGAMNREWSSLDHVWEGDFVLWTRTVTALLGTLLIYVMYRAALCWGVAVALSTALLVAVHPHLVRSSHFALTDIPLTLLVALTLWSSLRAADDGRVRWFLIAGLMAGLATATKYSGAVALLMPWAAAASPAVRPRSAAAIAATGAMLGGFLCAAPYSLLDLPSFLNSFATLAQHYNQPRPAMVIADQYLTYVRNSFSLALGGWWNLLGWPAVLLSAAGLIWLVAKSRSRAEWSATAVLLVFPTVYFWLISHQSLVFARYALPIIPMLCLGVALALDGLRTVIPWRRFHAVALLLVVMQPAVQAAWWDFDHRRVGTEELVARWLEHNVPPGDRILLETPRIRLRPEFHYDYTPRLVHESLESYQAHGVRYLVASSERFNPATGLTDMAPKDFSAYQRLFSSTEIVAMIRPDRDHPGPLFTILKVTAK
jgi:hypothetical protein